MRKIRNTLLFLIIVITLLAGGMKWLMYYYTKKAAEDIKTSLPPDMFSYSDINSPLDGKVSINNIRLQIAGETITIDKVQLNSENILSPIQLFIKSWGKSFPDELSINIKGITINTSSLMSNRSILTSGRFSYPLNIPCGRVKTLSFAEFVEMGYHKFIIDLNITYKLVSTNRIKVDLSLSAPDVIHSHLSYYGNLVTDLQKNQRTRDDETTDTSKIPRYNIPNLELQIDDFPLQKALLNYCANKEQQTIDSYLKNLTPTSKETIDKQTSAMFGLVLSQEIVDALNTYQKDPKELYLSIHPIGPNTLEEIQEMEESIVINSLKPQLRINGSNITLSFQWLNSIELARKKSINSTKSFITKSSERVLVPFEQLNSQAKNKSIEVNMANGIIYKGFFKNTTDGFLYMTIQADKGSSDTRLERSIIRAVYVIEPY